MSNSKLHKRGNTQQVPSIISTPHRKRPPWLYPHRRTSKWCGRVSAREQPLTYINSSEQELHPVVLSSTRTPISDVNTWMITSNWTSHRRRKLTDLFSIHFSNADVWRILTSTRTTQFVKHIFLRRTAPIIRMALALILYRLTRRLACRSVINLTPITSRKSQV